LDLFLDAGGVMEISRSASATGKRCSRVRPGGAAELQRPSGADALDVVPVADATG
jgi:hypothetical protein